MGTFCLILQAFLVADGLSSVLGTMDKRTNAGQMATLSDGEAYEAHEQEFTRGGRHEENRFMRRGRAHSHSGQLQASSGIQVNGTQCPSVTFETWSFQMCGGATNASSPDFFKDGPEHLISLAFQHAIQHDQANGVREPNIIDVGMNEGWYTVLSAVLGARVVAFEVQPACFDQVKRSLAANSVSEGKVRLLNQGLSKEKGNVQVAISSCSPSNNIANLLNTHHDVPLTTLADALYPPEEPISLLKIDAEASETLIMEGMGDLLRSRKVRRIIVEVSPQWWNRLHVEIDAGASVLALAISDGGFTPYVLPNSAEGLGAALSEETFELEGVTGLKKVLNITAFVRDRVQKDRGCNLIFVSQ